MDMPWGPEMTLVSACCWLISSQSKGFRLSRSPCTSTALLTVPGKEACSASEILLSPCHLSMHEGLGDNLGTLNFIWDLFTQKNKHKVSCTATEKTDVWQMLPRWISKVDLCHVKKKLTESSDSHWPMQNLGKEYFSTGKYYKTISDSLNTRYFKTYFLHNTMVMVILLTNNN